VRGVWLALLAGGVTGAVLATVITLRVARGEGLRLLEKADQNH
jgi:hypothetical protein